MTLESRNPGDVLEVKPLPQDHPGRLREWRLVVQDDLTDQWFPFEVDLDSLEEKRPSWMPLPGSQYLFLQCPVFETLYHGTRGPGKTETLLMDFAKDVGRGLGKRWRGILFRREYKDLDDIASKIQDTYMRVFGKGVRFLKSKSEYKVVWETGEELLLRIGEDELAYSTFHGHEYPWIGWDELTQWENDKLYKKMFSCCRSSTPGIPCRIRASTNPFGAGHNWVKKRWKLPSSNFTVIRDPGENPRTAVFGLMHENFLLLHATPNYATNIRNSTDNPNEARAWLYGDWNVTAGGMIDDIWRGQVHVIPMIPARMIPAGWVFTRSYDHGQSSPFATGWWLESNGDPIELPDGRRIGSVSGDLILWMEWYGGTGRPNEGIRMSGRDIAEGIRDREQDVGIWRRVHPGPADSEIYTENADRHGRSVADDMGDVGIFWERANKTRGSRKRGWTMLRTRLKNSIPERDGTRDRPGFFVCENCSKWIELVPPMPRDSKDPDDVPDSYEDHLADMTRYRVNWEFQGMSRKSF